MAVDINFGLLNAPNPMLEFSAGLETGRQRRREESNDAYVRQRQTRQDAIDYTEHLAKLDDRAKAAAKEKADHLASYFYSLKKLPYEQRKSQIATDKEYLSSFYDPAKIDAVDPTDGFLDTRMSEGLSISDQINADLKDATLDLRRQDVAADNTRADKQFEQRQNVDKERIGIARANLGVSQSNAARAWEAHRERQKRGGYGPAAGVSTDNDEWEAF